MRVIAAAWRFCDDAMLLKDVLSDEALEKIAEFERVTRERLLDSPKTYRHPWAKYPSGAVLLNNKDMVHFRVTPSPGGETLFRGYLIEPEMESTLEKIFQYVRQ